MNTAVVYHWWALENDQSPNQNIRIPILASIATLRSVNKDVAIYVLDGSDQIQDWKHYPDKLKFTVVRNNFQLAEYKHLNGWRNLSRLFDMALFDLAIPEENIIYCDADIFWLQDPLPFQQNPEKFCFNGYNSGYFYYNKKSPLVAKFFDLFQAYTITALNDENFRIITRQFTSYSTIPFFVIDEQIMTYIGIKKPDMINQISVTEHFALSSRGAATITETPRNIHMHAVMVENPTADEEWRKQWNRGITPLIIKELYDRLCSILTEAEIVEMYGEKLCSFVEPLRKSLTNKQFQAKLLATRDEAGFYHLFKALL